MVWNLCAEDCLVRRGGPRPGNEDVLSMSGGPEPEVPEAISSAWRSGAERE